MDNNFKAPGAVEQLRLGIKLVSVAPSEPAVSPDARGRARTRFKQYQTPHLVLLPAEMSALLPDGHLAWSIAKAVRQLDLSGILARYEGKSRVGRDAYDPTMMLTIIVYCYCEGQTSSRAIEKMCKENIPCHVLAGGQTPDHDTINNFLLVHRHEFHGIFQQVLEMTDRAGLVELDHVSVDGSKVKANASKRKAMSYGRMRKQTRKLRKELKDLRKQLNNLGRRKDKAAQREAQRLLKEIEFRQPRLERIERSKKDLEDRIRAKEQARLEEKKLAGKTTRKARRSARPKPDDQINFTDSESRIMHRSGKQFEQSYNGQIVVDSLSQIIVACDVVQDANDKKMLEPMLKQVVQRLGRAPNRVSGDSGYFSDENLAGPVASTIELLIPPDRKSYSRNTQPVVGRMPANLSSADKMRRKLSTKRGKELYARRKCIVEPVFGQIKNSVFAFDQFSWRGLDNVRCEWALVCAAHNLVKLHRSRKKRSDVALPAVSLAG
ncbi:MAG TPA: IS1182 family transposase [Nitrososphaera sp.]|nr:IS1182 family transposase [Nitrososphaera sp.]